MYRQFFILFTFFLYSFLLYSQSADNNFFTQNNINDNSIQLPDEMERNFEQLLIDWEKNFQRSPSCNQLSDEVLTYPDSVYIHRLYSLPSEMELAYNPVVRSYIDMYASRRKRSVEYLLAKGVYYFPMIEETLDKHGLPLELKYLPIIESALNPIAVSRAGATGLWQFMLKTGKIYNLEVNSLVDERRDPLKASEAAAKYLKDLYNIYEDWNLAIAAYNCGPGNVNKAIRRSGGVKDYWAIYPYLPKETRGYVPAFIAATYIMNYYDQHNICPMEYKYPLSVDTLYIKKSLHFQQIADVLDISIEDIRELNPQYKKDMIPGDYKEYTLCLPTQTIADFINNQDTIFIHKSNQYLAHRKVVNVESSAVAGAGSTATRTHKIKSGETLSTISKKYGVSVAQLKKLNNLKSDRISAGKTLTVSVAPPKPKEEPKPIEPVLAVTDERVKVSTVPTVEPTTEDYANNYYDRINTVSIKDGEPLSPEQIAQAETEKLNRGNTEENEEIEAIEIVEESKFLTHIVQKRENLDKVAKKYNVKQEDIITWNNLASKKLKAGSELIIYILTEQNEEQSITLNKEKENNKDSLTQYN